VFHTVHHTAKLRRSPNQLFSLLRITLHTYDWKTSWFHLNLLWLKKTSGFVHWFVREVISAVPHSAREKSNNFTHMCSWNLYNYSISYQIHRKTLSLFIYTVLPPYLTVPILTKSQRSREGFGPPFCGAMYVCLVKKWPNLPDQWAKYGILVCNKLRFWDRQLSEIWRGTVSLHS